MKCPVDQTQLVIADRQGIEIDYCPECRGVWLDRGELDKLIERSNEYKPQRAQRDEYREERRSDEGDYREHRRHDDDDNYRGDDNHGHGKRKKESFLGDMFDF